MSEYNSQVQAYKARHQRIEQAGVRYLNRGRAQADIEQSEILAKYVPDAETLSPIPNKALRIACEIAFPKMIMNHVEACMRATLREFPTVTMLDLKSARRTRPIVTARQIAMFVAKKVTAKSLPDIGRRFGQRDHTTVLHAVRKIEHLIAKDANLAAQIERIKENIPEVGIS